MAQKDEAQDICVKPFLSGIGERLVKWVKFDNSSHMHSKKSRRRTSGLSAILENVVMKVTTLEHRVEACSGEYNICCSTRVRSRRIFCICAMVLNSDKKSCNKS